jgi:hypothetical protein
MLRKRVRADRIVPSSKERYELLRLSSEFGHLVGPLLEVVTLPTYRRWINDVKRGRTPKKSGRPHLAQELRGLVVRLGEERLTPVSLAIWRNTPSFMIYEFREIGLGKRPCYSLAQSVSPLGGTDFGRP